MQTIEIIAKYCGYISTMIALAVLVIKPLRTKITEWMIKTSNKEEIHQKIDNLTQLVEKSIEQNKEMQSELSKQSLALQATLRNSILSIYNSRISDGYLTLHDRKNLSELYDQYKLLGGNSFVADCVKQLKDLPVRND